jgi:hypothetical protein
MFDPKKIACHFSEQLYAKQVRLVIKQSLQQKIYLNSLKMGESTASHLQGKQEFAATL